MEIADYPKYNAGEYATLPEGLQSTLNQYFQPHNQQLMDEFSLNFSWN
jgi:hypothetical protein